MPGGGISGGPLPSGGPPAGPPGPPMGGIPYPGPGGPICRENAKVKHQIFIPSQDFLKIILFSNFERLGGHFASWSNGILYGL